MDDILIERSVTGKTVTIVMSWEKAQILAGLLIGIRKGFHIEEVWLSWLGQFGTFLVIGK
jgi:hypothetical protein